MTAWRAAPVGYACSSEAVVRFGLGANRVAEIAEVRWPGGGRILEIVEEVET